MGAAMDDQRLVALAQEGNPDAFSLLVERHQTMVYNLALGKTGSPQDAEEVTQTAFLKAWQGLPAFQGRSPRRRRPGWRPTWPSAPSAGSWPRSWKPSRPKRPP